MKAIIFYFIKVIIFFTLLIISIQFGISWFRSDLVNFQTNLAGSVPYILFMFIFPGIYILYDNFKDKNLSTINNQVFNPKQSRTTISQHDFDKIVDFFKNKTDKFNIKQIDKENRKLDLIKINYFSSPRISIEYFKELPLNRYEVKISSNPFLKFYPSFGANFICINEIKDWIEK